MLALKLLEAITPATTYTGVSDERRVAMAEILAAELQNLTITNLVILNQKIAHEPVLQSILGIKSERSRILVQAVDCKST